MKPSSVVPMFSDCESNLASLQVRERGPLFACLKFQFWASFVVEFLRRVRVCSASLQFLPPAKKERNNA
jgi:hypothetical protein